MAWIIKDQNEADAIKQLATLPDRAAAIVAGALLDIRIESALRNRLHNDPEVLGEMLRPAGPLGSFSTKIKLGYLLGIYSQKAYRDMHYIKEVRNEFAHKLTVKEFSDPTIHNLVKNIKHIEKHIIPQEDSQNPKYANLGSFLVEKNLHEQLDNPRKRYLLAVRFYVLNITPIVITSPIRHKPAV